MLYCSIALITGSPFALLSSSAIFVFVASFADDEAEDADYRVVYSFDQKSHSPPPPSAAAAVASESAPANSAANSAASAANSRAISAILLLAIPRIQLSRGTR